jgi:hypothetical protein
VKRSTLQQIFAVNLAKLIVAGTANAALLTGKTPAAENAADNVYVSADAININVTYDGGGTKTFYWEAKVGP